MSKVSVDTSLTEALVCKAPTLEIGIRIRSELIHASSFCWFFLYSQTCELYVTNEFGGRIKQETLEFLQAKAQEILDSIAKESLPS
ncbi:MAG TPA: hypothetical protein VM577_05390 [Anaerovoracaceae bacterium]|nr:hypothetical protein [Anaerovoracaceae bacterium]